MFNEAVAPPWPGGRAADPMTWLEALKNCTVPVGIPLPGATALTVAVIVRRSGEAVRTVVVDAFCTTRATLLLVDEPLVA